LEIVGSNEPALYFPSRELARLLASKAAQESDIDLDLARKDVQEALVLAAQDEWASSILIPQLKKVERLIELSNVGNNPKYTLERVAGLYEQSSGFEYHTLTIRSDGTYDDIVQSDAIDVCTGGRDVRRGEVYFKGSYLFIKLGLDISRYGIDAPDVLLPVF
jgi:hypothetical protein